MRNSAGVQKGRNVLTKADRPRVSERWKITPAAFDVAVQFSSGKSGSEVKRRKKEFKSLCNTYAS